MTYSTDSSFPGAQDEIDPLNRFQKEFYIPQKHYFAGNSLGAEPKRTASYIHRELEKWGSCGSLGHTLHNGWINYHEQVAPQLASLVDSLPSEVIAMNSLTVNLHLMLVSFYKPTKERFKILVNPFLFPSDRYALQTEVEWHHLDPKEAIIEVPSNENGIVSQNDIEQILDKEGNAIALVWMEGVNYLTGQAFPIDKISSLAHQKGALAGFDLAHSIGNLEFSLHNSDVDFAVWCTYKYLNAGPGSVGGCFVHEKHHHNESLSRLGGWFGHDKKDRFATGAFFHPIHSVEGWQISNPPIFSLASLKASLDIFHEARLPQLRKKSIYLTGYLEFLLQQLGIEIITPPMRGCQLSFKGTQELCKKLIEAGIICDYRPPHVIRIAPAPLYNTFQDVYQLYLFLKHEASP